MMVLMWVHVHFATINVDELRRGLFAYARLRHVAAHNANALGMPICEVDLVLICKPPCRTLRISELRECAIHLRMLEAEVRL